MQQRFSQQFDEESNTSLIYKKQNCAGDKGGKSSAQRIPQFRTRKAERGKGVKCKYLLKKEQGDKLVGFSGSLHHVSREIYKKFFS